MFSAVILILCLSSCLVSCISATSCWRLSGFLWLLRQFHTRATFYRIIVSAFYGDLFPKQQEAAFSNCRLWISMGMVISFIFSNFLCIKMKLYLLIGNLLLGYTCYMIVEFMGRRDTNSDANTAMVNSNEENPRARPCSVDSITF